MCPKTRDNHQVLWVQARDHLVLQLGGEIINIFRQGTIWDAVEFWGILKRWEEGYFQALGLLLLFLFSARLRDRASWSYFPQTGCPCINPANYYLLIPAASLMKPPAIACFFQFCWMENHLLWWVEPSPPRRAMTLPASMLLLWLNFHPPLIIQYLSNTTTWQHLMQRGGNNVECGPLKRWKRWCKIWLWLQCRFSRPLQCPSRI